MLRVAIAWLGRRAALFAALVAAILIFQSLRPSFDNYRELSASVGRLQGGRAEIERFARDQIASSDEGVRIASGWTRGELESRIGAARRERAQLAADCGSDLAAVLQGGAEAVIDNRKRCIRTALLTREIDSLTALSRTLDARRPGETLGQAVRRHTTAMRSARRTNQEALARIRAIDDRFLGGVRFGAERRRDVARASAARHAFDAARRDAQMVIDSRRAIDAGAATATLAIKRTRAAYDRLVAGRAKQLGGNGVEQARGWAERVGLKAVLMTAAWALLAIILSPFLIRTFLYYIIAPLAAQRPAIRLVTPGGASARIPLADRSSTSVGVRPAPGEELLVRQDYLQASAAAGAKSTRWLLDWRHPLTSLAAGLSFLTRIRGQGQLTTVSAVRDPFAEVTVLILPEGATCVLHPRALAAVAQPIGRPVHISSHWRLGSLNAWLTLQLRFLVFHGPARLVVKGGRGVRVEQADRGRVFGQDQLIGFSADLAYSVTRNETFAPYLFGRDSLLRDKVIDGEGVLLVEEAPFAGRQGGAARGLEGLFDAALKVVGI